jgi:hypothetical protein
MKIQKSEGHEYYFVLAGQLFEMAYSERKKRSRATHVMDCPGRCDEEYLSDEKINVIEKKWGGMQSVYWRTSELPELITEKNGIYISDKIFAIDGCYRLKIVTYNKDQMSGFWWDVLGDRTVEKVICWCPYYELMPLNILEEIKNNAIKKPVSAFEYAIAKIAGPEHIKNIRPRTEAEEREIQIENVANQLSRFCTPDGHPITNDANGMAADLIDGKLK